MGRMLNKVTYADTTKQLIREAVNSKSEEELISSTLRFREYPDKIRLIKTQAEAFHWTAEENDAGLWEGKTMLFDLFIPQYDPEGHPIETFTGETTGGLFYSNKLLGQVDGGRSLKVLPKMAFRFCDNLHTVNLLGPFTMEKGYQFDGTALKVLNIPNATGTFGLSSLPQTLTTLIAGHIETLAYGALNTPAFRFAGSDLSGVTTLGNSASVAVFANDAITALGGTFDASVLMPSLAICQGAFYGLTALKVFKSRTVTNFKGSTFRESGLTDLYIGAACTEIYFKASGAISPDVPEGVTVHCPAGSYVAEQATANGFTVVNDYQ